MNIGYLEAERSYGEHCLVYGSYNKRKKDMFYIEKENGLQFRERLK